MAFGKKKEKSGDSTKSNKGIMVILFILGLIVLGGAAFGGVYLFMKTNKTVSAQPVAVQNTYMDLSEITVNLADTGGNRYFKGQLSLGYDKTKTKLATELTANQAVIRDDIIFYFKSKTANFINNTANEQTMKKELMDTINKDLTQGKITDVRFQNMLVQ